MYREGAPVTSTVDRDVLVGADWLTAHLSDPGVRVVEVDVSPAAYTDWHIDGAVLWNIYTDLKDPDYQPVDPPALAALLARSDITPDSTIVFYGYGPALGFWLMRLHGHADARILDCSRETWRSDGYPWSTAAPPPAAGRYELAGDDAMLRADRDAVRAAIIDPGVTLVDVRSAAEFDGERFWPSGGLEPGGRAGHVPTALHQPFDELYDAGGAFLPPAQLRQILAALDIDGDGELITYCTIGGRAATAWFVLTQLLGRDNVRVYDGSWAEWGRQPDPPVQSDHRYDPEVAAMSALIRMSLNDPEEVRPFAHGSGQLELVNLDAGPVGRATFQPDWRWSTHVKPIAGTESCQAAHTGYFVSGRMKVVMADSGEEVEYGPGDFAVMAPGHDAWIVGDEPCVVIDWQGFAEYAKPAS